MPKNKRHRRPSNTVPQPRASGGQRIGRRMGALLVVSGVDADLGRQVVCNQPVTIGRGEEAELTLNDKSVSTKHCSVEIDEETGHYVLVDLGSTNGTTVNQHQVAARYPLSTGDKIFIGETVIRFSLSDAVDLEYQTRVQHLVYTDPLTGLGSRRHYDVLFDAACERALIDRSTLTLIVIDMDGLKGINDQYGHEAGGFCITQVSHFIRETMGQHGSLHRFGGDEFVGCFPGLEKDKAQEIAETLRARVETHKFTRDGDTFAPTVSIGIATFPEDVVHPRQLFTLADQALYQAKRNGRNQVVCAGQGTPPSELTETESSSS